MVRRRSRRHVVVPRCRVREVDISELVPLVGAKRAKTLSARIADAAVAFASERYPDARRILRPIVDEAPGSATARELLGLTQYRLGNWTDAARQLESFREVSGLSVDQHPVLADCYRALKKYALVDELWAELRESSPSAELVNEGRIVVAGSLADRGKLADAVREREKRGGRPPRHRSTTTSGVPTHWRISTNAAASSQGPGAHGVGRGARSPSLPTRPSGQLPSTELCERMN
ncbi:MAG: tetratricopeptide repeat protein [Microthrixaceae bacterium]